MASPGGFFTSYEKGGHVVSYYGDNNPKYAGSVVKAMASAKDGFVHVSALFVEALRQASQEAREHAGPSPAQAQKDDQFRSRSRASMTSYARRWCASSA